jgi:hypothetical protein
VRGLPGCDFRDVVENVVQGFGVTGRCVQVAEFDQRIVVFVIGLHVTPISYRGGAPRDDMSRRENASLDSLRGITPREQPRKLQRSPSWLSACSVVDVREFANGSPLGQVQTCTRVNLDLV